MIQSQSSQSTDLWAEKVKLTETKKNNAKQYWGFTIVNTCIHAEPMKINMLQYWDMCTELVKYEFHYK